VLYNCLSWYKFVNTHLYHSRQLYNIHELYTVDTDGMQFLCVSVLNRCLLDRVIDIVIQCLRHGIADSSKQVSCLPRQTCQGSDLSTDHFCSIGAFTICSIFLCLLFFCIDLSSMSAVLTIFGLSVTHSLFLL